MGINIGLIIIILSFLVVLWIAWGLLRQDFEMRMTKGFISE